MKKNMNKKGFTIVELVIVIAVIAILAAVLIPTFISLVNKANLSADKQAVTQMNTVLSAETNVDSLEKAIDVLEAGGYNAAESLIPVSNDHAFYWYKGYNIVILVKQAEGEEPTLVWPEDEKYAAGFQGDFALSGDAKVIFALKEGIKYVDVAAKDASTLSNALTLGTKNIKIADNVTFNKTAAVAEGAEVILDLGTKTLATAVRDAAGSHHYALDVSGDVTVSNGTIDARGVQAYANGKITVEDGATINAIDNNGGAALWVYAGGEIVVNGGNFNALNGDCDHVNDAAGSREPGLINNSGKATIYGGTFKSVSNCYSVNTTGEMVINGGDFTASRGVVAASAGTLEITAGTFTTEEGAKAWCVYAAGDAQVVINGGTFNGANVFCVDGDNATITVKAGVVVNGTTLASDVVLNSTNPTLK